MLQPPRLNVAATYTQTAQRQGPRHEGFVEIAKQGDIDLLLHGDSITDWWVQGDANKAMFDKYFGACARPTSRSPATRRRACCGACRTAKARASSPRPIMLMIGTNNSGGEHRRREIAEGVGAVVLEMRKDFPEREDPAAGDLPARRARRSRARQDRRDQPDHRRARRSAARLLPGHRRASSSTTRACSCRTRSGPTTCTPLAKGYDIWGEAVKDKLAELMK